MKCRVSVAARRIATTNPVMASTKSITQTTLAGIEQAEVDPRVALIKIEVVNADLTDELQQAVISIALSAIEKHVLAPTKKSAGEERKLLERELERTNMVQISRFIKEQVDLKLGNTWHVIFGRSYATYVTHERQSFFHFKLDDADVVVWKHG